MKFSLIAVLVVFALAQGESLSLVKRDTPEIERLTKYFQDLSDMLSKTAEGLMEKVNTQQLAGQAQTYFEDGKAQLQPFADRVQEQLKPLASNIEDQLKPLADSVQAQLKPLADTVQTQLEDIWQQVMQHTKALGSK
ncbi:type-4 ice-structuring protein LS-12-like [Brienomyrus brachyistius]|uniref:type-4 ice-structuring protein LS-12-like n=1 Tax=Brienomyrus brachyistius TaxID=42636 RepID=UPI0020B2F475|nr:type-4 ice-structuring protein LS-12-like [Brienomyrus brachyistius]